MEYTAMKWGIALACALGLAPALAQAQATQALDKVVKEQLAADEAARASQERINKLDDDTQRLLSEYRRAIADAESYTIYAKQLEAQVESQNAEMNAMNQQLVEVETTSREVAPLMQRMLETLEQFVALDVPFLLDERRDRVAKLKEMMTRADVTISEKYRRIIEAYQVEMDYGRTVEAYEGKVGDAADARTVQLLRIGRVGLLYQTLDGKETGYWDANQKAWVADDAYAHSFKEGIAVARKTRAPEMLILPVPAPKEARS
jgi:chromosome segregation ATPase